MVLRQVRLLVSLCIRIDPRSRRGRKTQGLQDEIGQASPEPPKLSVRIPFLSMYFPYTHLWSGAQCNADTGHSGMGPSSSPRQKFGHIQKWGASFCCSLRDDEHHHETFWDGTQHQALLQPWYIQNVTYQSGSCQRPFLSMRVLHFPTTLDPGHCRNRHKYQKCVRPQAKEVGRVSWNVYSVEQAQVLPAGDRVSSTKEHCS